MWPLDRCDPDRPDRRRAAPATREYLQRKEAEGKSRIEALRCLKRLLARRYHRLPSQLSTLAAAPAASPDCNYEEKRYTMTKKIRTAMQ